MIVNLSAYIFYILTLMFPQAVWLGIATMLFNLFQQLGHALEMNIKLKTWYCIAVYTAAVLRWFWRCEIGTSGKRHSSARRSLSFLTFSRNLAFPADFPMWE